MENLLAAWREFRRGKLSKREVQEFEFGLEDWLFGLREDLISGRYAHGPYKSFYVRDPKLRHIHKSSVRDRVLHQAVFRALVSVFEPRFIFDSWSCRVGKGTHRAVTRLELFLRRASRNHSRPVWTLKCDIRKFFDSVDHGILARLIRRNISCPKTLRLVGIILVSFEKSPDRGLPLGNVTSQLFGNIYLNELDRFVKHELRARYYVRYGDDFLIVDEDKKRLQDYLSRIAAFLAEHIHLELHGKKIVLRKAGQGVDFLGYVALPHYRVLRTKTKRRILKRAVRGEIDERSLPSYLGILRHCQGERIKRRLMEILEEAKGPDLIPSAK